MFWCSEQLLQGVLNVRLDRLDHQRGWGLSVGEFAFLVYGFGDCFSAIVRLPIS